MKKLIVQSSVLVALLASVSSAYAAESKICGKVLRIENWEGRLSIQVQSQRDAHPTRIDAAPMFEQNAASLASTQRLLSGAEAALVAGLKFCFSSPLESELKPATATEGAVLHIYGQIVDSFSIDSNN